MKRTARNNKPSEKTQVEAIRRVLILLDGYIGTQDQDLLLGYDMGLMTWGELRKHLQAALNLPILSK